MNNKITTAWNMFWLLAWQFFTFWYLDGQADIWLEIGVGIGLFLFGWFLWQLIKLLGMMMLYALAGILESFKRSRNDLMRICDYSDQQFRSRV